MSATLDLPTPVQSPPPAATPPVRQAYRRAPRAIATGRLTWVRLGCAAVLVLLGIVVCRDAWQEIFTYAWNNDEYSHIFVVPFVAALLVYVRRLRLRHFRVNGTVVGPLLVATGLALTFAGYQSGRMVLMHGGAVMTSLGCVVSVLGKGAIFRFLPAILVLAFAVPVPERYRLIIAIELQRDTTKLAHVLLSSIGFANDVTGNTLFINGRPVVIAEACNGMRSVFMLLLLAFAFAFGLPLRNSVRILLLLASPFVALLCNVIRTLPTILMYGYAPDWFANPDTGTWLADQFHWIAGYAMYAGSFLMWLGIIWLMRWAMLPIQRYTLAAQ